MPGDLERALSKLRFDDQVIGYSLMTKAGRPFVSFSFPDDLFPRVKESISLYKADLRLMTIDTDKGLVVLSPVDNNWILTVLYVPELQLGLAIAKTKNVLRQLEGAELPPPPEDFEDSAEENLQVLERVAIQAASTSTVTSTVAPPAAPVEEAVPAEKSPEDFVVTPSTVPKKGPQYSLALSLDSPLYNDMRERYRNFGFDVLMLVDGTMTAGQIAEAMFQPNDRIIELLKWAASKDIVEVPEAEAAGQAVSEPTAIGRFVKCPKFEGDISKVRAEDRQIISMCDGTRTPEEIAEALGIPHAKVVQALGRNRRYGLKMIGRAK